MNKFFSICFLIVLSHWSVFSQSIDRISRDALLALRENRYNDAVSLAAELQGKLDKNNLSSYVEITLIKAQAFFALQQYEEALKEALTLTPLVAQDSRLMQLMGEIYFYMGRGNEALPYLADYIAFNPTGDSVGRMYYYMGEIYLLQARYQHAEIALSTAVYHNPNSDKWWFRLGYTREQVATIVSGGERIFALANAKNAYERVLQLNPGNNEAKGRIAVLQRGLR